MDNVNQYIIYCKAGYWEYFENIYEIYKPFITSLSTLYYYKDGDKEDLKQQGLIGLYKAIKNFDLNKNKEFDSLAKLCIRKSMLQVIRSSNAKKQLVHSNSVFLYDTIKNDFLIMDTIINRDATLPEDIIISKEDKTEFYNAAKDSLSSFEEKVFDLYVKEYSLRDISKELNINYKSVDNALARVKLKLKNKLELYERKKRLY